MERFERSTCLIKEVLAVIVTEILSADDSMQVGLKEFLYKID